MLVPVSIVLALLFAVSVPMMVKASGSTTGRISPIGQGGQWGGMDQVQINSDQQINLTGEDEKQMIKDLDDLRKMQQKLMKKMMEFRQKYGTMPVLEWVEDWRVAWNPAVRAFKGAEFACAAS